MKHKPVHAEARSANELLAGKPAEETNMKKKRRNFTARESRGLAAIPVMVWEEGKELVTQVDGKVYRAANMLKLDAALDAGGVPSPRNLYYVDEPDYEDNDLPANYVHNAQVPTTIF